MEVKIYEQEWKNGKLLESTKIHTVLGEDQISNLLLNTEQFKSNGKSGYNMYSYLMLHFYSRNAKGELNYLQNIQKYKVDNLISIPDVKQETLQIEEKVQK